jgi:hypothetical protein
MTPSYRDYPKKFGLETTLFGVAPNELSHVRAEILGLLCDLLREFFAIMGLGGRPTLLKRVDKVILQ